MSFHPDFERGELVESSLGIIVLDYYRTDLIKLSFSFIHMDGWILIVVVYTTANSEV